jgi:hypothetical protein
MRHTHRNGLPALRLEADLPAIATRRPARVGPAPKPCMPVIRFPVSPAAGPRASACLGGRYGRALTINRHDSDLKRTELAISSASHGTRIRLRVERRHGWRVIPRSGGHRGLHCTCLQPYSTGASCHVVGLVDRRVEMTSVVQVDAALVLVPVPAQVHDEVTGHCCGH